MRSGASRGRDAGEFAVTQLAPLLTQPSFQADLGDMIFFCPGLRQCQVAWKLCAAYMAGLIPLFTEKFRDVAQLLTEARKTHGSDKFSLYNEEVY